jgi:hypothetical protein
LLIDREALSGWAEGGGAALALEAVLGAAAGVPGPLPAEALARLIDALAPGKAFRGATLGGAVLAPASQGRAAVARDPGAVLGRKDRPARGEHALALCAGVWDGRFRPAEPLGEGETLVPAQGFRARLGHDDRSALAAAPPLARRTAPLILSPGKAPRPAAGVFIASQAIARRLLPETPSAWSSVGTACAALGYGSATHHMGSCRPAFDLTQNTSRPMGTLQA